MRLCGDARVLDERTLSLPVVVEVVRGALPVMRKSDRIPGIVEVM